jgi:Protein involved in cell division
MNADKYKTSHEESELLPNLLNLDNKEDIEKAEFEGFLYAELLLTEKLTPQTKFNLKYIQQIHKLALEELYSFGGKYRTVNMSKGGFLFPSAQFIPQNMITFEKEILNKLPNRYNDDEKLIDDVAKVHGELLFIHPFREGNGRTARVLANLMVRKQGRNGLHFERIDERIFPQYVNAVQMVAERNYKPMREIIKLIF